MSLDVNNFDLFNKKKPAPIAKPIVETPRVIEETPVIEEEAFEIELAPIQAEPIIEKAMSVTPVQQKTIESKVESIEENKVAKYETFLPITARIPESQSMELKRIENQIMRSRSKSSKNDRERVTVNSIMRCMITNFLERAGDLDLSDIDNEEMLKERMEKAYKQKYSKR